MSTGNGRKADFRKAEICQEWWASLVVSQEAYSGAVVAYMDTSRGRKAVGTFPTWKAARAACVSAYRDYCSEYGLDP